MTDRLSVNRPGWKKDDRVPEGSDHARWYKLASTDQVLTVRIADDWEDHITAARPSTTVSSWQREMNTFPSDGEDRQSREAALEAALDWAEQWV